jgi:hypothetical protein
VSMGTTAKWRYEASAQSIVPVEAQPTLPFVIWTCWAWDGVGRVRWRNKEVCVRKGQRGSSETKANDTVVLL